MNRAPGCAVAACLAVVAAGSVPAATRDAGDEAAFTAQVRAATERYQDRAQATADGYRLIGRDFPGMGEHWLHVGRLFDGTYDAERPEFLTYVSIGGRPRLLGVAYALPLLGDEQPPEAPAGRAAWHTHAGTLDEETLAPHHGHHGGGNGPRLAMVHAWVWLPNPEGTFAADNWAIPYLRLGLRPRTQGPVDAGKALSLLAGTDLYLAEALSTKGGLSAAETRRVRKAITEARAQVAELRRSSGPGDLADHEAEALAGLWQGLWRRIAGHLGAETWARVESLSIR